LVQRGCDALSIVVAGDARGASYEGRSMTHPVERRSVERRFLARANAALMLGLVCGGLALCALGAVAFDLSHWLVD
jgi:hypothetical protein